MRRDPCPDQVKRAVRAVLEVARRQGVEPKEAARWMPWRALGVGRRVARFVSARSLSGPDPVRSALLAWDPVPVPPPGFSLGKALPHTRHSFLSRYRLGCGGRVRLGNWLAPAGLNRWQLCQEVRRRWPDWRQVDRWTFAVRTESGAILPAAAQRLGSLLRVTVGGDVVGWVNRY